ncbi:MAG: ankyrin repeat domain-containing protein [Rhodobacteraceae bacterium]|nr:ankyrin repeat domain-containing protein [Paracoccaceae bacterium]
MKHIVATALVAFILTTAGAGAAQAQGADCNWAERIFWEEATAEAVADCITSGANVNADDEYGRTPLHWARTAEAVQALLAAGADVNARDDGGWTPLHSAAAHGTTTAELIQILVKAGADIEASTGKGRTPFDVAMDFGNAEMMQGLIDAGTSIDIKAQDGGWTAAALLGDAEMVRGFITEGADIAAEYYHVTQDYLSTPLHVMAHFGTAETVWALVKAGVDVELWAGNGFTPLHTAAQEDNAETVQALIDAGANIYARDKDGFTPLQWAELRGNAEAVLVKAQGKVCTWTYKSFWEEATARRVAGCIAAGANIHEQRDDSTRHLWVGYTPLHGAAEYGTAEMVRILIQAGADMESFSESYGVRPLHMAAAGGNLETLQALIDAGANVNTGDRWGLTPLHSAKTAEAVQALVEAGADIEAQTRITGSRPLHAAVGTGDPAMVKAMIDAGADVNARDELGRTPLSLAGEGLQGILREAGARE